MTSELAKDVAAVGRLDSVPRILDVVCRATGLGFAAIARVTETRWVACAVRDQIAFGLKPGGELEIGTTICDEIRRSGELVVIEDADADPSFAGHPTPKRYGFRSYISAPIVLPDGTFFGTLCAIDPRPAPLKRAEFVGMFQLFTELIAFHLDARQKLAASEAALHQEREDSRAREHFLATLAHELRNPLAPLRNGVAALHHLVPLEYRDKTVGMMERQLGQLVRLVDDLLDASRLTAGKLMLDREPVRLRAVVEAAVETARPVVDGSGHALAVDFRGDPVVDGDAMRLTQAVTNLLNNAAKYTPRGGRITVALTAGGGEGIVRVSDTGVGIPATLLSKVFDRFMQVESSRESSQGGMGLGLTLVRRLAEMHGGSVTAESEGPGRGSTFVLRLPAAEVAAEAAAVVPLPGRVTPRRVLIADDNVDGADSMAQMLEAFGHRCRTANDGAAAVREAEAFRPDLLLMDVDMPVMNGYEATRRIREHGWGQGIKVVALTGWGEEDDLEKARTAGCDGHLLKPVGFRELEQVIAKLSG